MRLHEFIVLELDTILSQWEEFAATQTPAASRMSQLELRNHAQPILLAIARDLQTPQTREQQAQKAMGRAPV